MEQALGLKATGNPVCSVGMVSEWENSAKDFSPFSPQIAVADFADFRGNDGVI